MHGMLVAHREVKDLLAEATASGERVRHQQRAGDGKRCVRERNRFRDVEMSRMRSSTGSQRKQTSAKRKHVWGWRGIEKAGEVQVLT